MCRCLSGSERHRVSATLARRHRIPRSLTVLSGSAAHDARGRQHRLAKNRSIMGER